jgi:hypothetical protein
VQTSTLPRSVLDAEVLGTDRDKASRQPLARRRGVGRVDVEIKHARAGCPMTRGFASAGSRGRGPHCFFTNSSVLRVQRPRCSGSGQLYPGRCMLSVGGAQLARDLRDDVVGIDRIGIGGSGRSHRHRVCGTAPPASRCFWGIFHRCGTARVGCVPGDFARAPRGELSRCGRRVPSDNPRAPAGTSVPRVRERRGSRVIPAARAV